MPQEIAVEGIVEPWWGAVADAFAANFRDRAEVGAACCVYRDTLQLVFSTTKGATAVCAHLLAQRGQLDLDAPIADVWPEFAANNAATVGLPADGIGAGARLLDAATVTDATKVLSDGTDLVTGFPMRNASGFMLAPTIGPVAPSAFGHSGAGGSFGFADTEAELGFGYVMHRMVFGDLDPRADLLAAAAYRALG